jgi:tRNA (cytidine/uridine-2'-O-)-methyltransferase
VYSEVRYPDVCYLVFGKETAGLPEELLARNPQTCVRLPMLGRIRSLNLANTVAVGVYEALRQWDFDGLQAEGELRRCHWDE